MAANSTTAAAVSMTARRCRPASVAAWPKLRLIRLAEAIAPSYMKVRSIPAAVPVESAGA
jgi:hypothetical protein